MMEIDRSRRKAYFHENKRTLACHLTNAIRLPSGYSPSSSAATLKGAGWKSQSRFTWALGIIGVFVFVKCGRKEDFVLLPTNCQLTKNTIRKECEAIKTYNDLTEKRVKLDGVQCNRLTIERTPKIEVAN